LRSFGQNDFFQEKADTVNLRSDSFQKFAIAAQTLEFEKPSSLRTDSSRPPFHGGTMIFKNAGGARAAVKKV
jgi:hypothetical protein